jgi:DnaJ-class molecular chaperone
VSGPSTEADLYDFFGIDPEADDADIRRAYHRLAKRWHPDHAGPDTAFVFQKLARAYEVLSDPRARATYDRLRRAAGDHRQRAPGDGTRDAGGDRARSADAGSPSAASTQQPPTRRRAPGVLIRRISSPLNVLLACGIARRIDDHLVELALEPDEVAEGGMATIAMRVPIPCAACAPSATATCARCGEDLFAAWLAIRPDVADGTLLAPSALLPGMRAVTFRVRRA